MKTFLFISAISVNQSAHRRISGSNLFPLFSVNPSVLQTPSSLQHVSVL